MSNASGFAETINVGKETTFKNPPADPVGNKLPVSNPLLKPTVTRFKSDALTGSPQPRSPVDGKIELQGSFDLECNRTCLEYPLQGTFGPQADQGLSGNYDHIFNLGTIGSYYIEQQFNDISKYLVFTGCRFDKLSFSFAPEGIMKATVGIMGCVTTVQGTKFTEDDDLTDQTSELPISYLAGAAQYKGAAIAYLQDIKLDINRQAQIVKTIDGTNQPVDIITQLATVGGSVTALFQDSVMLEDALNSTEVSLRFFAASPTLGHGIAFKLPTLKWMPNGPITNGPGGLITQNFTFDAYGSDSTSKIKAFMGTKGFTTVTVGAGTTDTLNFFIDTVAKTVTLTAGTRTPTHVAADMNAIFLTTATAFVENGRVIVETATAGTGGSVQLAASNGAANLGLPIATYLGYNNQAISVVLSNQDATF